MSVFQRILNECEQVALTARWVTVDEVKVSAYCDRIQTGNCCEMQHAQEFHLLGKGDHSLEFFLLLDSINFGSGYFPYIAKTNGASGYFTIAGRLTEYIRTHGMLTPAQLVLITPEKCSAIFRQDIGSKHAFELMSWFALAWNDLGRWTLDSFDGDYLGFLKRANTAEEAIASVTSMRLFQDVSHYFGKEVSFLKRAQILIQDMKIAEPNHRLLSFPDLDELTVFADNVLPYVFRVEGLMRCDEWLEQRIHAEELIAAGSPEEVELRACSVYIADTIARILREENVSIPTRMLDFALWQRGQELKKISPLKRHRTRCPYY